MKKILILIFLLTGSLSVFCNNQDTAINQEADEIPAINLTVTKKDLTTNAEQKHFIQGTKFIYSVNKLNIKARRNENNDLILRGITPRFKFKIRMHLHQLAAWEPSAFTLQFANKNSMIHLNCTPALFGLVSVCPLFKYDAYDQISEMNISLSKDSADNVHSLQRDVKRHYYGQAEDNVEIDTLEVETTHTKEKVTTEFLVVNKQKKNKLATVKIINNDAKIKDINYTLNLSSNTSAERVTVHCY